MAYTKIKAVKNHLQRCLNYAANPSKTEPYAGLKNLVAYTQDEKKTEHQLFVTGINCNKDRAYDAMLRTKQRWDKDRPNHVQAYHVIQSFAPGEVTPQLAHKIGCEFARRAFGERYEATVSTHLDKGHLHNHVVFNSVSFVDGKMFRDDFRGYYKGIREVSDTLCREYSLSLIEPKQKGKAYAEWQTEQQEKPTVRGLIRADIDRAILASTTERGFIKLMGEMGYQFKTRGKNGQPLKYPALKPPDAERYFRIHTLGKGYTLDEIKARILQNLSKQIPFPEERQKAPRRYRTHSKPHPKPVGLRAQYYRYCYELHFLVKHPTSVKRVSFLLREDIAKLDRLDAQTRFLGKRQIGTIEELTTCKEQTKAEITALTAQRQQLRAQINHLTRQGQPAAAQEIRGQISEITKRLRTLRKEVVTCEEIAQRSSQVKENLERLITQKLTERKELNQDELRERRCGRADRADVAGRQ